MYRGHSKEDKAQSKKGCLYTIVNEFAFRLVTNLFNYLLNS